MIMTYFLVEALLASVRNAVHNKVQRLEYHRH